MRPCSWYIKDLSDSPPETLDIFFFGIACPYTSYPPSSLPFPFLLSFGLLDLVLGAFCDYDTIIFFFLYKALMKMKTGICALDPCFLFFWPLFLLFFLGYDFMGSRFVYIIYT